MAISRLEEIVFAVNDLGECARFCEDFGLVRLSAGDDRIVFQTATGQRIVCAAVDSPGLPAGVVPGAGIREVVWGVSDAADLDWITAELSRDRAVTVDGDGTVHSVDETGFAIAFRVQTPLSATVDRRLMNTYGHTERYNAALSSYGQAAPRRAIHVALDLPKEGREKARAFYEQRLHFRAVEEVVPTGVFLQCEGEEDHHQLFLCHRTDRPGINHVAFEARDFDEVVEGGNHLVEKGWKEARRLGRHTLGSNVFRFFHTPIGCRFEYVSDMDKVEKGIPTRVWETSPPHHLWMIKTNAD
ncbi:MAG: VOC family protein [Azospirillaceae bacterium]|nr:VOC family protein [Azospirillaceae bacterium]